MRKNEKNNNEIINKPESEIGTRCERSLPVGTLWNNQSYDDKALKSRLLIIRHFQRSVVLLSRGQFHNAFLHSTF